ncbi:MAG TPA: hypothetical protein VMA53_21225 [Stellaceae bacterium]|nr:hypothetical protein [Stellaceae bacterium]
MAGIEIVVDRDALVLEAPASPPRDVLDLLMHFEPDIVAQFRQFPVPWSAEGWHGFYDERVAIHPFDGAQPEYLSERAATF